MINCNASQCVGCCRALSAGMGCPHCRCCDDCCQRWSVTSSCMWRFLALSPSNRKRSMAAMRRRAQELRERNLARLAAIEASLQ